MKKITFLVLLIIFICVGSFFCLHFGGDKNYLVHLTEPIQIQKSSDVYHIFFHSLILYPDLAFSKNDGSTKIFKEYMITKTEFEKILQQLYDNNFVLISADSIYGVDENGKVFKKIPDVPAGKKPLIISLDDLNYYDSMKGRGFADKLVFDADGNVVTQVITPDGATTITRDGDVVPILDDFVKSHPDFSVNGARGIIAVTGYEGILGYRTSDLLQADEAKKIVSTFLETNFEGGRHQTRINKIAQTI